LSISGAILIGLGHPAAEPKGCRARSVKLFLAHAGRCIVVLSIASRAISRDSAAECCNFLPRNSTDASGFPQRAVGRGWILRKHVWQIVLPVLRLHLSHLGFPPAQIGVLISTLSATMGVVELLAGMIVAVLGRRWTMIAGFEVNAICLIVAALSHWRAMQIPRGRLVSRERGRWLDAGP
jgi:hypothetical protein